MPVNRQKKLIQDHCNECKYPWRCWEGLKRNFEEDSFFGVQNIQVIFRFEILISIPIPKGKYIIIHFNTLTIRLNSKTISEKSINLSININYNSLHSSILNLFVRKLKVPTKIPYSLQPWFISQRLIAWMAIINSHLPQQQSKHILKDPQEVLF